MPVFYLDYWEDSGRCVMNLQKEIAETSDTIQQYIDFKCQMALEEIHRDATRRLAAMVLADYSRNGGNLEDLCRAYA